MRCTTVESCGRIGPLVFGKRCASRSLYSLLGIILGFGPKRIRILVLGRNIGVRCQKLIGTGIKSVNNAQVGLNLVSTCIAREVGFGFGKVAEHKFEVLIDGCSRIVRSVGSRLCYDRHTEIGEVVLRLRECKARVGRLLILHYLRKLRIVQGTIGIGNTQI